MLVGIFSRLMLRAITGISFLLPKEDAKISTKIRTGCLHQRLPKPHLSPLPWSGGVLNNSHGAIFGVIAAHEVFAQFFKAADCHQEHTSLLRVVVANVRACVVLSVTSSQGHLLGIIKWGATVSTARWNRVLVIAAFDKCSSRSIFWVLGCGLVSFLGCVSTAPSPPPPHPSE